MAYQYGCRPNRDPTRWGGAGAPSQVFCAARSWRRGNSLAPSMFDFLGVERPQGAEPKNKTICQRQMVLFLVRAWGLEPQRRKAREPKGYVTLVKDFQSPPYHKGRASFPTLQKIFGRDRPNTCQIIAYSAGKV